MACHANGEQPEGYDAEDPICHNCADKFTCLPAAIAKPSLWVDRGVRTWDASDDLEVAGVLAREMTYSEAIERMTKRMGLEKAGTLIPAELLTRRSKPALVPDTPAEPEPAGEVIDAEGETTSTEPPPPPTFPDPTPTTPAKATKATKPKAAKKPAKAKPAKAKPAKAKPTKAKPAKAAKKKAAKAKPAKAKPKKPAKPKAATKPAAKPAAPAKPKSPTTREPKIAKNGKPLPLPKTITTEKMLEVMATVKLGMKVDLEFGMQIVRRARTGKEHVVTLTENGFLYEDEQYSSLSAAAQNASGTPCRSGNDWFSLVSTSCTEVRDTTGKVVARKGMDL
jgi:hypothetical protein